MSDLFGLNDTQMARLEPFFPKSHGKPRVDDRRVLSGIIFINRNGLRRRDAPSAYGLHKTPYNRWKRWRGRLIARTTGGMNTKLQAICDSRGRPLNLFVTAGRVSDYIGARALLSKLPDVDWLLGDRSYDADWFREALKGKGYVSAFPAESSARRL